MCNYINRTVSRNGVQSSELIGSKDSKRLIYQIELDRLNRHDRSII